MSSSDAEPLHGGADDARAAFGALGADEVLDALESVGIVCDGRLQALNSFENRVYLAGRDGGGSCVVKFYRPARWSDAQILEEHRFAHELRDAEIPVVPLSERDSYVTLSECRDIVTNMRPASQVEYDLKQKLLRAISDSLYSTSHRVELHVAKPVRATQLPIDS